MELYLLRHGIAEPRGPLTLTDDRSRALTKEGIKKMRRIGQGMRSLDLPIDLVLSSPFARARQTAEIVVEECLLKSKVELTDTLAPGGDPEVLIKEISTRSGSFRSVLIVGHEPFLSQSLSMLIAGDEGCAIVMKKGGLCKLTVNALKWGRCASLEWFLTPGQLRRM
jgi:phosphohistidine phosphatase